MFLPRITIALPAYNAAATIGECLASLLAQEYPAERTEIIVADNGSTDATPEIVARDFPQVRVLTVTNGRGSAYGRNAAFAAASGEYICSIDADCAAAPDWARRMVQVFENAPQSVACLGGCIAPYSTDTAVERFSGAWVAQRPTPDGLRLNYAATPNAAFRREAFEALGGFDTTQGFDDVDFGYRLTDAGYEILYIPVAVVRHRNPSTVADMYRHRVKYGGFHIDLKRIHPARYDSPDSFTAKRRLVTSAMRQIAADLFWRLPRAAVRNDPSGGTPWWPALDAVQAWGYAAGALRALRTPLPSPADSKQFHFAVSEIPAQSVATGRSSID